MAAICSTCTHPERNTIEAELVARIPLSRLARDHGLTRDALRRHRDRHLSPAVAASTAVRDEVERRSGLVTSARERIESLVTKLEALVERTHDEKRESMLLQASRELRASIELAARLSGELRPEASVQVAVVNLSTSPEWQETRTAILDALMPFPQAQIAVAGRLARLTAGDDQ